MNLLYLIVNARLLVGGQDDGDGLCRLDRHGGLFYDDLVAAGHSFSDVASSSLDVLQIRRFAVAFETK